MRAWSVNMIGHKSGLRSSAQCGNARLDQLRRKATSDDGACLPLRCGVDV